MKPYIIYITEMSETPDYNQTRWPLLLPGRKVYPDSYCPTCS